MSAQAALTLADGAATPVSHTFTPRGKNAAGVAIYEDLSGGIAVGFPALTLSTKLPAKSNNGSQAFRVTQKVVTPVLEVTAPTTSTGFQPAPTKAYELSGTVEFVIPQRATLQQRKDLFAFLANLLANAQAKAMVVDLDTIW